MKILFGEQEYVLRIQRNVHEQNNFRSFDIVSPPLEYEFVPAQGSVRSIKNWARNKEF